MAEIPKDEVTLNDLYAWYESKKKLAALKASEHLIRMRVFKHFFKSPKEGTNTVELEGGYELKAVQPIDRKIEEKELKALAALKVIDCLDQLKALNVRIEELDPQAFLVNAVGINLTKLVVWKPELSISEYRKLTDVQAAIFDRVLIVKDGSPQMDVVPSAAKKKELEAAAAPQAPAYIPAPPQAVPVKLEPLEIPQFVPRTVNVDHGDTGYGIAGKPPF